MSVNFSQNSQYIDAQNAFGAGYTPEAPAQFDMLKSMGLPSTADEFVKFSPYFATAVLASKLISNGALAATRLNPKKFPETMSVADSFNNSKIGRLAARIDNKILPVLERHSEKIGEVKGFLHKYTPDWIKNCIKQIKIGVTPKNRMALGQYKGMTNMAAESFIGAINNLPADMKLQLGLDEILKSVQANKLSHAKAVTQIAEALKNVKASTLQSLKSASGSKLKLLDELNKSKAFIAENAKTGISKGLQKSFMSVAEAAGGGVVGGGIFGILMNSIFLASTFKRTWDAPWGEKLSTFMEGALVDFCGGYLMALLGTKITYKLLGIKNLDKTPLQTIRNKKLYEEIIKSKKNYAEVKKLIELCNKGHLNENVLNRMQTLIAKLPQYANKAVSIEEVPSILSKLYEKYPKQINRAIDRFAKTKKLQNNGFIKNLINRPIRWVANFFSVGLESIPAKIADGKNVSKLRATLQKSKNIFKGILGYPVRFLLVLMVVTPPLTKLCAKISHTLFGKPTKSIMDDREGNEKNIQQNPYKIDMDTFAQYTKLSGALKAQAEAQQKQNQTNNSQISQSMINNAINSQQNKITETKQDNKDISPATYIPNTQMTEFKTEIPEFLNEKLKRADSIGMYAQKELDSLKH